MLQVQEYSNTVVHASLGERYSGTGLLGIPYGANTPEYSEYYRKEYSEYSGTLEYTLLVEDASVSCSWNNVEMVHAQFRFFFPSAHHGFRE
jgi:hypothetical protein